MHFTYVLYSGSTDVFYRGQTNDVTARLERHNAGLVTSTRLGRPWVLLWYTSKSSRSDAMKLEKKLKNLSRKRLLEL